jgi:hypothetical protein
MLDVVINEFRSLAKAWNDEVTERRRITTIDPVADDAAHRARELTERIRLVEQRTEMLTPTEFAKLHSTTPQTVTTWCRGGKVECEPNGKSYLIPRTAKAPRSRSTRGRKRAAHG